VPTLLRSILAWLLGVIGMNKIYETNYELWLDQQIENLRQGVFEQLDIPHLVEELEGLNKSNKRELESYLIGLLTHLLKWEYQPHERSGSWSGSIKNSRKRIGKLFKDQPSLITYLPEVLSEAYLDAKVWASEETGIKVTLFPEECPYQINNQILGEDWLPD